MNLCQYYRAHSSVEELLDVFKQIGRQLDPTLKEDFLLVETQFLEDSHGSKAREELWETDKSQLWFRIQPDEMPPHPYNIHFTLRVESTPKNSILCQLFHSSENASLDELLFWIQIQELAEFDTIREIMQQRIGIPSDETDSPKITIGNIEAALTQNNMQIARTFAERCWTQHYSPQKFPDQWWVYFCELRRTLLESVL